MDRQRILLHKDAEYDHLLSVYKMVLGLLRDLVNSMKLCDLKPTPQLIKAALRGDDLRSLMTEQTVSKAFSTLPKTMLSAISSLHKKENEERYVDLISNKADQIRNILQIHPVKISYFNFENEDVTLSPEHIKQAEDMYCVFADSPGKFKVYDAWEAFVTAKKHLEDVVRSVPKRSSTQTEQYVNLYGNNLIGVAAPGNFSIGKICYDGNLVLNGENFDWIL